MEKSTYITWYEKTAPEAPVFANLACRVDADICILGSSIVGLSAALHLAEEGKRVVVVEPSRIGYGSSGRAGGLIESGLNASLDDLAELVGPLSAHKFWQSSINARNLLLQRIKDNHIQCDLQMGLLKLSNKVKEKKQMQHNAFYFSNNFEDERISYLNERTLKGLGVEQLKTGMKINESGAFNPLTFLYALADLAEKAGVKIYENSPVTSYKDNKDVHLETAGGSVNCNKLIVCGNAYMDQLQSPEKTRTVSTPFFQLVTDPIDAELLHTTLQKKEAIVDTARLSSYIHFTPDNRLVIGGPVKNACKDDDKFAERILSKVSQTLPTLKGALVPHYLWKGPVGVPMNYMPVFAQADRHIYTAHGFNGHGVSLAYMAGKVLADAATGDDEMFDLFSKIQQMHMPRALQHILAKFGVFWSKFEDRIF